MAVSFSISRAADETGLTVRDIEIAITKKRLIARRHVGKPADTLVIREADLDAWVASFDIWL